MIWPKTVAIDDRIKSTQLIRLNLSLIPFANIFLKISILMMNGKFQKYLQVQVEKEAE